MGTTLGNGRGTSSGRSPCRRNFRGILLRAYLQPLKYMLQEQPKEKDAPQVSESRPWHAHVRLQGATESGGGKKKVRGGERLHGVKLDQ